MKNKIALSIISMIILLVPVNIKALSFSAKISGETEVEVGKTIQLKMDYIVGNDECGTPDCSDIGETARYDITTKSTWASSDTEVATVDEHGVVTGKKLGSVTITATGMHPEREDETELQREATYEIDVIESTVEPTPEPANNQNESEPQTAGQKNTDSKETIAAPNTHAAIPLYITGIGSLCILLSVTCYIFINRKR